MKKLLLLGALISSVAMAANTVEVRAGVDLSNRATFKKANNSRGEIRKEALKNGFELAAEYRKGITENFEIGGGIAYKYNKLTTKKLAVNYDMKGISAVPLYFTARYNFKNSSEFTPYVKANLGVAFSSGKAELTIGSVNEKYKFGSGIYSGLGAGVQYKNFLVDLSYNVNSMKTKYNLNFPGYSEESKYNTNHGVLTLGFGYSFGF